MPDWEASGDISRLQIFHTQKWGCILGVNVTYGGGRGASRLLGMAPAGVASTQITLRAGESFDQAQYKLGSR